MVVQPGASQRDETPGFRLADMLFLICHHPRTRVREVAESTAGLACAAGLVGELLIGKNLVVESGSLLKFGNYYSGHDHTLMSAIKHLSAMPAQPTVAQAVDWLRADAYYAVAGRLERDGLATVRTVRKFLGGQETVCRPAENLPAMPMLRLNHAAATPIDDGVKGAAEVSALAGLISSLGLAGFLDADEADLAKVAAARVSQPLMLLYAAAKDLYLASAFSAM